MNSKNHKPDLKHLQSFVSSRRYFSGIGLSLLSIVVGIVAGLGAIVFRDLIALLHNLFFLGRLSLDYNANVYTPESPWGAGVIFVPVLGAIIVAFLVKNFAPEARGHGVPEVMDAIHYNKGIIRPVVAVVKALASAISIGSGGSVGREGPIVQIGSSFGSTFSQWLRLPTWKCLTLIACGAGGGIAATFNTPLGGMLFAVEIMMQEVSARTLVPVIISTVTATYIGRIAFGPYPSFVIPSFEKLDFTISNPLVLLSYILLGIVVGLMSTLFIRSIYWFEDVFEQRVGGSYYRQHILGMILAGILFYSLMVFTGHYHTEGVGYSTVQDVLSGWHGPALLLLVLSGAKLLATSLALGSGASGGIFSPSLFMGATLGGAFGFLLSALFPTAGISPAAFAVAGMAGMVGSTTGAAITSIAMIFEMTFDYNVILPMTLTVAIAYEVRKMLSRESIYTFKLVRRGHRIPDSMISNIDFSYRATDIMNTHISIVPAASSQDALREIVASQPDLEYFLLEENGKITGISLRGGNTINEFCTISGELELVDSLHQMHHSGTSIAIVSYDGGHESSHVRGIVTKAKLEDMLAESMERYEDK